jgi:hypothetical protein
MAAPTGQTHAPDRNRRRANKALDRRAASTHSVRDMATGLLLDHLVGTSEQRGWYGEAERFCSF